MKKIALQFLMFFFIMMVLNACRPPEVEGTVINIQKQLYEDAYASAESAIQKYPQNAEAWFYWGWLNAEHKKNYEEMNKGFNKALELNPNQKVSLQGGSVTVENAVNNYRSNLFTESFNSAIKLIQKSQQTEEEESKMEMLKQGRDKLLLALEIAPDRKDPYFPLAVAYASMKDTTNAASIIETGIAKHPDDEEMLVEGGDLLMRLGELEKAEEPLNKALAINPQRGDVYQKLGQIASSQKDWDKSNEYFQKAIELNPDDVDLAYNIGVSNYNQQQYEEAIPFFKKVLEATPDDQESYSILGICYVQSGKADEGIEFLEKAVERFPDDPSLWEYLAILYGKKGMGGKADEAFAKSKSLKGESED